MKYQTFLMQEKSLKYKTVEKQKVNYLKNWRNSEPQAWKAKNLKDVLIELYGSSNFEKGDFELDIPEFPPYYSIKLNIKSKIKFRSIAILKNTKPQALVAVFNLTQFSIIDYDIVLRSSPMASGGNLIITVVGQAEDGKLYGASIVRTMCLADCDEY